MSVISLNNISFSYGGDPVLHDLSLEFEAGKLYCITGKSGAGKTTLLSILSGLAEPDKGSVYYKGKNVKDIDKYEFRSKYVGVVFQGYNLMTKFTALDNIILSMDIAGVKGIRKRDRAIELLRSVGLNDDECRRYVLKLSGGQQQRVAIARALSFDPDTILADEPTGNLDHDTQREIMDIFRDLANQGKCVILVSHSPEVAELCDECYELKRLSPDKRVKGKRGA